MAIEVKQLSLKNSSKQNWNKDNHLTTIRHSIETENPNTYCLNSASIEASQADEDMALCVLY